MSVHADDRMDELDFQSALHVLVHPDMGLAVGIVERPGTELVDIALVVQSHRHGSSKGSIEIHF